MRKDIEFPVAKAVYVAAVKEWDKEFLSQNWNVYFINARKKTIETVLVMSRGKSEDRKTSTLRHGLGNMAPDTVLKVEFIPTEVLEFTNEYWVTFFEGEKLYERRFVFEAGSISENKMQLVPVLNIEGVLAE